MKKLIFLLSVIVCGFFVFPKETFAIGIKPLRTELEISPGGSQTSTLKIINTKDKSVRTKVSMDVYVKNDDNGFPIVAELDEDDPRNIKPWISISEEYRNFVLEADSEKEITFTVTVPAGAEPGGHYASVIYEDVNASKKKGLGITPRVASLLLIKVRGKEIINGEIEEFGIKNQKIYNDKPVNFILKFKNEGNIHVKPQGQIFLTSKNGKAILKVSEAVDIETGKTTVKDQVDLNNRGGNVLPKSARIFNNAWNKNLKSGNFIAELDLKFGTEKNQKQLTSKVNFDTRSDLKLNNFEIKYNENGAGIDFILDLKNNGKIYERPVGNIIVENEFGTVVSDIKLEKKKKKDKEKKDKDEEYLSPNEEKKVKIDWINKKLPKGNYTAKLTLQYGLEKKEIKKTIKFSSEQRPVGFFASLFGVAFDSPAGMMIIGLLSLVCIAFFWFVIAKRRKKEEKTVATTNQKTS